MKQNEKQFKATRPQEQLWLSLCSLQRPWRLKCLGHTNSYCNTIKQPLDTSTHTPAWSAVPVKSSHLWQTTYTSLLGLRESNRGSQSSCIHTVPEENSLNVYQCNHLSKHYRGCRLPKKHGQENLSIQKNTKWIISSAKGIGCQYPILYLEQMLIFIKKYIIRRIIRRINLNMSASVPAKWFTIIFEHENKMNKVRG